MKYIYVYIICTIINITKDGFISHNIIELRVITGKLYIDVKQE